MQNKQTKLNRKIRKSKKKTAKRRENEKNWKGVERWEDRKGGSRG